MAARPSLRPVLLSTAGLACLAGLALHASPALSRGGLSFSSSTLFVGGEPRRVEAAELDGDGDVDLVVLSASIVRSSLASWRNDGPLGFALHWETQLPKLGTSVEAHLDLDLGDLDADGSLDLVHFVPHGSHDAHLNAGDGSFPTSFAIQGAGGRTTHSLADLDADGALDLAYHDYDIGGYLGTLIGQNDGTFALLQLESFGGPLSYLVSSALCEGDGDGHLDLVLAAGSGLLLAGGTMSSGVPSWSTPVQLLLAGSFFQVEAFDVDRDGHTDLIASQPTLDRVCVLRALPGGGFAHPEFVVLGLEPESIAIADFDGDGLNDLAASSSRRGGRVYVRLALPGGGYGALWQTAAGRSATDLSAADLDGDGDCDLVVADALLGRLVLLSNQLIP